MQVTAHPIRKKQYPKYAKKQRTSYGTKVFTVGHKTDRQPYKTRTFEYLPHVSKERHLGHPVSLGDDIIVEIHFNPSKTLVSMYEQMMRDKHKNKKASTWEYDLKREVRWISAFFFKLAIDRELKPRIHKLVPYATGRLQRGMIATVNRCVRQITKLPHILKLNTLDNLSNPIYYANPVNNMPTEWLAHPPNEPLYRIIYHSTGPKIYFLHDPTAETDWYSKVIDSAQQWIKANTGLLFKGCVSLFGRNFFSIAMYIHLKDNMKFK